MLAVTNGHANVVKELKDIEGIDPDFFDSRDRTPLMHAAAKEYADVVKALVEIGEVNRNYGDFEGKTALMLASENGHANAVAALEEIGGVNPNYEDPNGKTALILASEGGHVDAVAALRSFEDNSNFISRAGSRFTTWVKGQEYEPVEPIDPNKKDLNGNTAYILAYENDSENVLEELQKFRGIDKTTNQPKNEVTLLGQAASLVSKTALRAAKHVLNHKKITPIVNHGSGTASGLVLTGRYICKGEFSKAGRFFVFGLNHGMVTYMLGDNLYNGRQQISISY